MIEYRVEVDTDGSKYWYLKDELHREDGPAVEWAEGTKCWHLNGKLHREDGPACEYAIGTKSWYLNDNLHREDGPAVEYANGDKSWYINDKLHREDGPAIEYANGDKHWYLNGERLTEQGYKRTMPREWIDAEEVYRKYWKKQEEKEMSDYRVDAASKEEWAERAINAEKKLAALEDSIKELFNLLDTTEETDEGRRHRPVRIIFTP